MTIVIYINIHNASMLILLGGDIDLPQTRLSQFSASGGVIRSPLKPLNVILL